MTTDARRLMRPRAVTSKEHSAVRLQTSMAKGFGLALASLEPRVSQRPGWPYEGTSRMKGNFHVRFFGGRGRATARAYPAYRVSIRRVSPVDRLRAGAEPRKSIVNLHRFLAGLKIHDCRRASCTPMQSGRFKMINLVRNRVGRGEID